MPIHKDLVPALRAAGKVSTFSGRVFLKPEGRPPNEESLKKPWREAVESVDLKPAPRIHDLRHCWKTKAIRSGLHPLIADAIGDHGDRKQRSRPLYFRTILESLCRENPDRTQCERVKSRLALRLSANRALTCALVARPLPPLFGFDPVSAAATLERLSAAADCLSQ